ncbi:MAG: thioredoxin [Actinobacteria bacterium]|nr:thioredoxin [Actinomycetota bacterium]
MAHQVALESIEQGAAWLQAVVSGERPSEPVATLDEPAAPADDGPVRTVTTATFESEVLGSELPVVVDFWAPWCGPCRQVAPVIEQMARMRDGTYKFVKINIDENPEIAQTFDVQSIPLIGLFRNGRLERASLGAKPRQQLEAELGMLVIP